MTARGLRRLYSVFYDSVVQGERARLAAERTHGFALLYRARLRLDAILSGTIVLTDAQLLDGAFFLRHQPQELLDMIDLGAGPGTLTVRSRHPDLTEALLAMVTDPGSGRVRSFEFSAAGDDRELLAAHLQALGESGRPAPADLDELAVVLRGLGLPTLDLQPLLTAWRQWADAATAGLIEVESYQDRPLDLSRALTLAGLDGLPADALRAALPDDGELVSSLEADLLNGSARRTELYARIRQQVSTELAREQLMGWVDKVFGLAFRDQHDCVDFDQADLPTLRRVGARLPRSEKELRVDDETLDALVESGMTAEVRSDFMPRLALIHGSDLRDWAEDQASELAAWRSEGRVPELRRALNALDECLARHVSPRRLQETVGLVSSAKPIVSSRRRRARRTLQLIKRWGGATATAGVPAVIALTTGGPIAEVAGAWWLGPAAQATREVALALRGRNSTNATMITTDVALPRRRPRPDV